MKKASLKILHALAPALLAVTAGAQTNFNPTSYLEVSVTPNQQDNLVVGSQVYDGVNVPYTTNGLTGASPSWTLGSNPASYNTHDFYIGFHGTNGSLELKTGILTLDVDDFKLGYTEVTGDEGDLKLDSGTTLNVNLTGQYSPGLARNGNDLCQVVVSNSAVINFDVAGATEQRWDLGNGGLGTMSIYGGQVNVSLGTSTISDTTSELVIGNGAEAVGTLNLYSGTFTNSMPLPTVVGGSYTGLPTGTLTTLASASYSGTVTSNATALGTINISNGVFAVTATYPPISSGLPNNEAAFAVGTGYVNFLVGGSGQLALANWTTADYQALVSAGQIRVGGLISSYANFSYSSSGGMGILQLAPLSISGPAIETTEYGFSTNAVLAGEPVILMTQIFDQEGTTTNQWLAYNSANSTWTNVPGATNATLSLNTLSLFTNGVTTPSYYLVSADTTHGLSATSAVVQITISAGSAPVISSDITPNAQPDNPPIGSTFTYTATFTGDLPLSYQWQKSVSGVGNWNNISGATNTVLRLNNISAANNGYYQLTAANVLGHATSSVATLVAVASNEKFIWSPPLSMVGLSADQVLNSFSAGDYVASAMWCGTVASNVYLTNGTVITFSPLQSCDQITGGNGTGPGAGLNTNSFGGNLSFSNLLGSYNYYDAAHHYIFMSNLIPGQQYIVQLFSLEDRSQYATRSYATPNSETTSWQDPNNANDISESYPQIANDYMVGLMWASNSVEEVQQNLPNTYGNFQAIVVRSTASIPPPYWTASPPPPPQPVYVSANPQTVVFNGTNVTTDMTIPNTTITYQWQSGPPGGPYTNIPANQPSKWSGTTSMSLTVSNVGLSDNLYYALIVSNGYAGLTNIYPFAVFPQPTAPTTPYAAAVVNDNPYAFWQLNETNNFAAGGVVALDLSGHGYFPTYGVAATGEYNGVTAPNYSGFAAGQGALGTVANTPTSAAIVPSLNINTNTVTIAMWIYPNGNQAVSTGLLLDRNGNDVAGFTFGNNLSNGVAQLGYVWNQNSAATYNWNSGVFPPAYTWSFVVLVISPTNATVYDYYQDPSLTSWDLYSAVNNVANNNESLSGGITYIGSDSSAAARTFNGSISDVAVFNQALSPAQVLQLFSAGVGVSQFPPFISVQPAPSQTTYAGQTVQVSATPAGSAPITNQWYLNGGIVPGATNTTLVLTNATVAEAGSYQLFATNAYGYTASSNAVVNLIAIPPQLLVGRWLNGASSLAEVSGYRPAGTHDGFLVSGSGTSTNYHWTNDLPPNATGSAIYLNNAGIAISNSSAGGFATDPTYMATYDDAITNSFTVMCWSKGWPGSWNSWVSKWGESPPEEGWQLRVDGSGGGGNIYAAFTVRDGSVGTVTLGNAAYGNTDDMGTRSISTGNDGKWHHYAGAFDAVLGIRNLYIDGVLAASEINNKVYTEAPLAHLVIGAKDGSAGDSFQAFNAGLELYDVRIYNYALSEPQIAAAADLTPTYTSSLNVAANQLTLTWPYGNLLTSTNLAEPWTTNLSATSPYTVTMTNSQQYFKILNP